MSSVEKMVSHALAIAADDSHGYSQGDRWLVDRDCSSLMYESADEGGFPVGRGPDKTRYTGTMLADFTAAGFTAIPFPDVGLGGLVRGDVLLNVEHHTEMYVGDGLMVGAHVAETGGVYGQPGDQTGNEISVVAAYVYWAGWDYVLRPPADSAGGAGRGSGKHRKKGKKMECIIRPNGENYLVYFDGTEAHPLTHPDEVTAIREVYKICTGSEMPIFEYGSKEAPWAARLFEGASRRW